MSTFEPNTPIDNSNKESESEIKIPFWSNDPNILFRSEYIFEFFPVEHMSYEQKLNAVSRGIILIALLTFLFSRSIRILVVSAITLFAIFMLYFYQQREKDKSSKLIEETFVNQAEDIMKKYSISKGNVFDEPTSSNPFGNVLVTDYEYNPEKKPAPPSFNNNINDTILKQAKQLVSELNPDQPDISDKLFKDLGEQYVFEQSLRPFSSNPSTTIPNDQTGFAEFCYGSMVSCKEGNLFACARNLDRYTNY